MLQKIEIRNFQSHKATNMALGDRVNTIQGNSDCGKSAVMRALNWLIFNPAGDYFVSDWAKSTTGKVIKEPCEVTVHVDGHVITRRRDKDFNGYILDGQTFEATRNSVPQQVAAILGLGEVNIQRQLDPPFLLSMSAGDVSRYINSLVNLTRIDTWTAAVNGRSKSLMKDVERYGKEEESRQAEVDSYGWLPDLERISARATELEGRKADVEFEKGVAETGLARHDVLSSELCSIPDLDRVEVLFCGIDKAIKESSSIEAEMVPLRISIEGHTKLAFEIGSLAGLDHLETILEDMSSLDERKFNLGIEGASLEDDLNAHDLRSSIIGSMPDIDRLEAVVSQLGRMDSVRKNMSDMKSSVSKQLERYGELETEYVYAMQNEQAARLELSTIACPLCGRKGDCGHGN